jgi:hypothetical protein
MAVTEEIPGSLNEQQVIMLRLLKNPLPDDDFRQMRNLAVKLLSSKLDLVIDEWENRNEVSEDIYDKLSKGHFRSKSK